MLEMKQPLFEEANPRVLLQSGQSNLRRRHDTSFYILIPPEHHCQELWGMAQGVFITKSNINDKKTE